MNGDISKMNEIQMNVAQFNTVNPIDHRSIFPKVEKNFMMPPKRKELSDAENIK